MKKSAYKNFKTLSEFTAAIREAEEYQVLDKMTGVYRRPNARECRRIALELVPKESYFQTQIIHYLAQLQKGCILEGAVRLWLSDQWASRHLRRYKRPVLWV